ncbi:helix-turn-helix transcriptional regulator [Paraburkholderia sp.]|uniref:helix-turn-helix transcriptional regulator n=1 Tax=Paraburkholderia sp. TaxID=1926495 RepID=UPI0039E70EA8
MKLPENLNRPAPDIWGRSPVAWHPDAEAGFTLKFDGPPLTLLNQHAPKGAANVGLAHVHDPGDTYASVRMHWAELSAIFALQLALRHMSEAAEGQSPSIGSTTLKRVNAFIAESLDRPITLDDLAMAAGLSKFHFLRAFTRTVGMTPAVYLMHRRVQVAIAMAKHGKEPFAEIAYATGFADHSHLSR